MFQIEQSPLGRVYVVNVPRGFALFYTTRDFDGYLTRDSLDTIHRFIRDRFDIDAALWTCNQVHGTGVQRVDRRSAGGFTECDGCDALWSDGEGMALGIKVADCLPVTVVDPKDRVMANIHSGWRGTAGRISVRTLDALANHSAFSPAWSHAYLGPSIRQCCFEVGEEVIEQFASVAPPLNRYVDRGRGPRPYLDLVRLTTDLLMEAGFPRASIHDSRLCTRCGTDFHSYRRDGKGTGRNLAIVAR